MGRVVEIPFGARYGLLRADGECRRRRPNGKIVRLIHCLCDCGGDSLVAPSDLVSGNTQSCGCGEDANRARLGERRHDHTKHGMALAGAKHPLYMTWQNIKQRCYNPNHPEYLRYGARGITLHAPWHDFEVFAAEVLSEIGERPEGSYPSGLPLYSIDRRDNDRGYEPGNVRWATKTEQNLNRRGSRVLTG